jgi:hypothetical protein
MSVLMPPPAVPRQEGPGGDDLDRALRAFLQAEMPDPWPDCPATEEPPAVLPARPARLSPWRSRFALAASVALFVAGGWFLSDAFHGAGPEERATEIKARDPSAEKPSIRKLRQTKDGPTEIEIIIPQ